MKKATVAYLLFNFAAVVLYVFFVLRIREGAKAELRDYYDFGDSLNFIMTGVPVLLVCVAYSLFWSIRSVVEIARRHGFQSLKALAAVTCVWTGLLFALKHLPSP
jgi:hypothetical protein